MAYLKPQAKEPVFCSEILPHVAAPRLAPLENLVQKKPFCSPVAA